MTSCRKREICDSSHHGTRSIPTRKPVVKTRSATKRARSDQLLSSSSDKSFSKRFKETLPPSPQKLFDDLKAHCANTENGAIKKLYTYFQGIVSILYSGDPDNEIGSSWFKKRLNDCFEKQKQLSSTLIEDPSCYYYRLTKYLCNEVGFAKYLCMGHFYFGRDKLEEALKCYNAAIKEASDRGQDYTEAYLSKISCLKKLNRLEDIKQLLRVMHEKNINLKHSSPCFFFIDQCLGASFAHTAQERYIEHYTFLLIKLSNVEYSKEEAITILPLLERFTADVVKKFRNVDKLSYRLFYIYYSLGDYKKAVNFLDNLKGKQKYDVNTEYVKLKSLCYYQYAQKLPEKEKDLYLKEAVQLVGGVCVKSPYIIEHWKHKHDCHKALEQNEEAGQAFQKVQELEKVDHLRKAIAKALSNNDSTESEAKKVLDAIDKIGIDVKSPCLPIRALERIANYIYCDQGINDLKHLKIIYLCFLELASRVWHLSRASYWLGIAYSQLCLYLITNTDSLLNFATTSLYVAQSKDWNIVANPNYAKVHALYQKCHYDGVISLDDGPSSPIGFLEPSSPMSDKDLCLDIDSFQ